MLQWITLSIVLLIMGCNAEKTPLYFSYITTLTGDFIASGAIPIVDEALRQINNRDDILQNYTLNYTTILDSECSSSPAINAFLHHFKNTSQPTYITSLCCGCSGATIPVAEISHHWNIPQVAFAAAATTLNDRERFKYFFRALPSVSFNSFTYAQLMREFGWTQMAIVTQKEQLFTKVVHSLEMLFAEEGWELQEIPIESNFHYDTVFNEIADGNHKIIVLNCYVEQAIVILCEANHRGMRYPEYMFFPLGGLGEEWWESYPETITPCSHSEIAEMVKGTLSIVSEGFTLNQDTSVNTTSGQSIENFHEKYRQLLNKPEYSQYSELGIAAVAFDSMWSIAIGLDIASRKIAACNDSGCSHLPGALVPLERFDYDNQKLGCIMKQSMDEVAFTGVTRKEFRYIDGHAADNVILLKQEREDEEGLVRSKLVAKIDNTENVSVCNFLEGESIDTIWENGVPYDGAPVKTLIKNSLAIQVIYYVLACCGLGFAAVCAVFNITFHHKKTVKLASPNLNYIILLGSALLYSCTTLYVHSVDSFDDAPKFTVMCNVRFWIFSLGYTSCFAVILSKQWRIYYILNNPTAKKKKIKDQFLLIIIVVLIAIDVVIIMVDTVIPETRPLAKLVPYFNKYSTSDTGMLQENYIFTCSNKSIHISLMASFIYKALLQVLGIFMAFHTRKIKIKVLNDSKEITAIIYINSIILVSLVITEFGLRAYNNAYAALFGLALLIEATLFIGIVFIPKMVNLYLDPHGRTIFSSTTAQQPQQMTPSQMKQGKNDGVGSNDNNPDTATEPAGVLLHEKSDEKTKTESQSKESTSCERASSLDEVMEIGLP